MKFNLKTAVTHHLHAFGAEKDSHEYMHPQRDWMLVLGCSVIVFLGGAVYSALDFYTQFVMPPGQISDDKVIKYRDTEILEAVELYDKDEQKFAALRADMPPIPAPATTTAEMEIVEGEPLAEEGAPLYTEGVPTLSP